MPVRKRINTRRAPYRGRPINRRARTDESPPMGGRGNGADGCIKIVVGRSKVRIWNNCGEPITIEDTLQLAVANTYVQRLSNGGKALVVFGDPAEVQRAHTRGPARGRGGAAEGGELDEIVSEVEKWI